jgi:xanthine dehydrogenase small subunit
MEKDLINSGIHGYTRISFYLNGEARSLEIAPGLSSLDLLNKTLHLYGTKCSCNEGDCGACTVVIAHPAEGNIVYEAINSCLYPAARLHGKHLITVEGLGSDEDLHPIQTAILEHHASQCGYCTPGFVMSMFALFASIKEPDKETILAALEGNLCRCTGYQSILEAAQDLAAKHDPESIVPQWCRDIEPLLFTFNTPLETLKRSSESHFLIDNYYKAGSTSELIALLAAHPEAALIAGGTDVMVQVNVSRKHFKALIDLGDIPELQKICLRPEGLHIGAGVSYSQVMDSGIVRCDYPALIQIIRLIASKQIRNFGTLAGNVANASPIGDTLPLLLVYDAILLLESASGQRSLPLKDFFLAYRKTALQQGEYIREIILPKPQNAFIQSMKSAKRKSVDISSVASAIRIERDGDQIVRAELAFGGVAATPVLSTRFEDLLLLQPSLTDLAIAEAVAAEFSPMSDVRGSAEYRKQMVINHTLQYLEAYHG